MTASNFEVDSNIETKLHIIEWNHLNLWKFYPMALASSWSVRCLLYPMSVVKSRLQLQKQNNVYNGMTHAFTDIVKKEGFGALYRGFWVTLPQISASFVYSSVYEKLRNVLNTNFGIDSAPIVSSLAGGAASTCTQLIFVPTDIVAQYMMVYNNSQAFTGGIKNAAVVECLKADKLEKRFTLGLRVIRSVYKVDGLLGFYRGFLSSVFLYIPSSMVFWSTYYHTLNFLKAKRRLLIQSIDSNRSNGPKNLSNPQKSLSSSTIQNDEKLLLLQAISGSIGGISAAIFTNPLEILRIRIQMHRTNFLETVRRLIKYEGLSVFTKGLAPRMINNGIYSCLIMVGYETVKRTCVLPEYRNSIVW